MQDFVAVERAHAEYLHTLTAQCFLTTQTISRIITNIFKWFQLSFDLHNVLCL